MKKIMKFAGITLAVILLLLFILPFAFQGKIEKIVKAEGYKMLNAQFDFRSLDISLFRNFPSATITLKEFWLKGTGEFENDTLAQAGELTAAVNLFSLFGNGGYDVSKISMDDIRLHAIVLKDGRPNWDVMKSSSQPETTGEESAEESTPIRIKLQKLTVNNFTVVYDDRQGDRYAEVNNLDLVCSGDFGSERTILKLEMQAPSLTYRVGDIPFLSKTRIKADMDIDADFVNKKYTLRENTVQLNAVRAAVDGWIATTDNEMNMDIRFNTNEVGFKEVLSLIPAIYAKDFDGLKTDGSATLTAFAKGTLRADSIVPRFNVSLNVKNGMFRYPSLPAGVTGINISATVENPGGKLDSTTVSINPFDFVLAGNPFSFKAEVRTPVSDLDFRAEAKGKLDLGKVKEVYPLENIQLNGLVNADMSLAGRLSYIDKEQFDRIQAAGSIRLSDMKLQLDDMPLIDVRRSTFSFSPRYLQLSETTVNIGLNDLTLDSRFENYLGYALKGTTLKGTLNVSSNRLNLNDFMSADTTVVQAEAVAADTANTGIIRVPANIDFRMQTNLQEVLLDKMKFNDVRGLLIVKDGKVDMQNLSLNTMGGSVVVNGVYATPAKEQPRMDAGFRLSHIDFARAYTDLDMVRQLAPVFSGLKGNFSGTMKVNTLLDRQMSPVLSTLQGNGNLSTKDLSLSGVKFIDRVADIVKKPSLKEMKVKDLSIDFTITEGMVTTQPFDLKLGDYNMNLSGSTGLDQTIDYKGKITLPVSIGKVIKTGTVDMNIGGTFTSPKVSVDMESLAKNLAEQALQGLGEQLNKDSSDGSEKKENIIDKALDLFKKKKK